MNIIQPHKGFQEKFVSSNVDIVIGGGILAAGKSFAACLMQAEPLLDPNYRALMLRKNIGNLQAGGGLIDEIENIYGSIASIRKTGNPCAVLPSGARIDFTHVADEDKNAILERAKGWQYDSIYFDELTAFDWQTFATIISRNRGKGLWTGKIRGTCNPKKSHWLRTYLDWYIGADGYIIPERDGVVRYVYPKGDGVEGLVFGSTKSEVYELCKLEIDEKLRLLGDNTNGITYEDYILSTVFYKGSISENKSTLGRDRGYIGKVAMMGASLSKQNQDGNWNIDPDEDLDAPISQECAKACFTNDPMLNEEKWLTADIADFGTDNVVILAWQGLHVIDMLVLCRTNSRINKDNIRMMASKHQIGDSHIIYDATNARYISEEFPNAIPYLSSAATMGMYKYTVNRLKDECYMRLVNMINNGMITIDKSVFTAKYPHIKKTNSNGQDEIDKILVSVEFLEECSVVRFVKMPNGKQRLFTKYEMNKNLGKGRSMDLLDPFAMRMYPLLQYKYGNEFDASTKKYSYEREDISLDNETIYDYLDD